MLTEGVETMNKIVLMVVASVGAWFLVQYAPHVPMPPPPYDPPKPTRRPLLPLIRDGADAKVGGDTAPDGTPVQIDYPQALRLHNTGGSDGAGLCVFTSINHAAIWQNVKELTDFQQWMKSKRGGGYPEKVEAMIAKKCGANAPKHVQVEGSDLALIDTALKTGRMASVTYGYSPSGRYGGRRISHMVSCVHADGKNYAVLDNNYEHELEWLTLDEFRKTYAADGGWTFVLLAPGPPPPPRNRKN